MLPNGGAIPSSLGSIPPLSSAAASGPRVLSPSSALHDFSVSQAAIFASWKPRVALNDPRSFAAVASFDPATSARLHLDSTNPVTFHPSRPPAARVPEGMDRLRSKLRSLSFLKKMDL